MNLRAKVVRRDILGTQVRLQRIVKRAIINHERDCSVEEIMNTPREYGSISLNEILPVLDNTELNTNEKSWNTIFLFKIASRPLSISRVMDLSQAWRYPPSRTATDHNLSPESVST